MTEFLSSTTSSTSGDDYNRFNRYWVRSIYQETTLDSKMIIKKEKSKKEEVHIFNIKDLDL